MTRFTTSVRRVAVPALVLAVCVALWARSYLATDTLSYHGSNPNSLSVSGDQGVLRVERSMITTASDRTLRYWHGRDPIESDPSGEGVGGFHHYTTPSGSWTWTVPFWPVVIAAALGCIYSLRRRADPAPTPAGTAGV